MKNIDCILQKWRMKVASKHIEKGAKVLDVGAWQGELFDLHPAIGDYWGIDPLAMASSSSQKKKLIKADFPCADLPNSYFDVVTMLAVLEHIPYEKQANISDAIYSVLKPSGKLIITVPSSSVDYILSVLKLLGLISGMSLDQHYGFNIKEIDQAFQESRFALKHHSTFQLGLNNLYIFLKIDF